ncbi:response regulator transcription factor [Flavobacterium sp.]|uniref:response regulator transcription factor n=1 Tax=Flavobacterium sp. TaxID=239 RepID=UPI002618D419|nr:response regulator transcription factor [Flavobacterium sp.]MDG2433395.1 response regulator transcription factor [Flavobacterium sp.]
MNKEILIVDDHLVVRTGVSIILQEKFKHFSISTASNYMSTIDIIKSKTFDLIILDINIPGGKNTTMVHEIREIQPEVKILIFSVYDEKTHACPYIVAGANGYLNKLSNEKEITGVVNTILSTGHYISADMVSELVKASSSKGSLDPLDILSTREREIANLLVLGDGNIEIANKLDIQLTTVSTHKNKIYNKLHIKNLVDLINLFKNSSN